MFDLILILSSVLIVLSATNTTDSGRETLLNDLYDSVNQRFDELIRIELSTTTLSEHSYDDKLCKAQLLNAIVALKGLKPWSLKGE